MAEELKQSVEETCSGVMSMFASFISLNANPINPAKPVHPKFTSQCYQVMGFDILFDSKKKAWLLEINDHPSMNTVVCKEFMGCAHKDCPESRVDLHVKS